MDAYDPSNSNNSRLKQPLIVKWNRVDDAVGGPTPRPRHGHRGVAIKELMLIFGGGNEGIVDELHIYDVEKNKWFVPVVRGDIPRGFAAYGMVSVPSQGKVFIFGGMVEFGKYSNDMYELQTTRWEWRQLRVRQLQQGPCPRLGHSFTLGLNNNAYVFGGLANESEDPKLNVPRYLNDLFCINLGNTAKALNWQAIIPNGPIPQPRESHTTVHFVTQLGKEQLILYGGMDGSRMNDVWIFDVLHAVWTNPMPNGYAPLSRSLHTANVVGNRMFVFGGWVPLAPEERAEDQPEKQWKCTNTMASLNLNSLTWEQLAQPPEVEDSSKGSCEPRARAGHSAVVINKRVYIWSGRDGYRKTWNSQVCCDDMWFLEVEPPAAPAAIQLVRASVVSLEIQWTAVVNADGYILQIQKVEPQSDTQRAQIGSARRFVRAGPGMMMPSPGQTPRFIRTPGYRQPRPMVSPAYPHPAVPQTRVIVQNASPAAVSKQAELSSSQQPKKQMVILPSPKYVQVQPIQPQQPASFDVLSPQHAVEPQPSSASAVTKTTYTAQVTPTIDQNMPTNILDEALNEAESFVDEQLQQQQKQQQKEVVVTPAEAAEANNRGSSPPPVSRKRAGGEIDEGDDVVGKKKLVSVSNSIGQKAEEEEEDGTKTEAKDESAEEFQIEQPRATPNGGKEEAEELKALDPTQQEGEAFQPLAEDDVERIEAEDGQAGQQQQRASTSAERGDVQQQNASQEEPSTDQEEEAKVPKEADETAGMNGGGGADGIGTALEGQQSQEEQAAPAVGTTPAAQSMPQSSTSTSMGPATEQWYDVGGTIAGNKLVVTQYNVPMDGGQPGQNKLVQLEPGFFYRFRICALNSIGQSKWSPVNNFKTCIPGYPGAPSSIKITKGPDGAHISWEPPQTTNGQIAEYSVYLAMRSASLGQPAFVPVYIGQAPNCVVNQQNLQLAHIDSSPKPAVIFRIAARNEKGYGPATQVRWLQDRPMAMMGPMLPQQPQPPPPQSTLGKRVYQQRQPSPMQLVQQPQPSGAVPGGSGYYAQTSGSMMSRYILQSSSPSTTMASSSASGHSTNVAMVHPQAVQQHVRLQPSTTQGPTTSAGGGYVTGYLTPQQQGGRQLVQRQSLSASPQHHQQQPQHGQILQQQQPQPINSGMTVREYLTGGNTGKRLRLEQQQ